MVSPAQTDSAASPRMSRAGKRILLTLLWAALAGIFLFRFEDELVGAIQALPELRYAVLGAVVLFAAWTFAAAAGWNALLRSAVPEHLPVPSLARLALIRTQAQAVNFILPTAGLAGESIRTLAAAEHRDALRGSVVAIVLDNIATAIAGLTLAAAAVPMLLIAAQETWQTALLASVLLIALGVVLEAVPFALAPPLLRRVRPTSRLAGPLRILTEQRSLHPAHRRAVGWHLLERAISVGEVHAVMIVMNAPATLADSAAIAAVFVLVSFAVFFVPAQLGVAELAVVMACLSLGISAEVGIAVALVRRSRQLIVCVAGLVLLLRARITTGLQPAWATKTPSDERSLP